MRPRRGEAGYTYLLLLFAVAAMGLVAAGAAETWSTLSQRERERELLFVGNQYRVALGRYAAAVPDAALRYPEKLEDLLRDPRFPDTRRYLRQIYADPMSGKADWVLLRQGERIVGLHSRDSGQPFKRDGFDKGDEAFVGATRYSDWKFVATAAAVSEAPPVSTGIKGAAPK
jgi:type II secretory pathway pseudopilin PulG